MIPDSEADARIGYPVMLAFDTHAAAPTLLEPPPDPRLAAEWQLRGYVTGLDAIFRSESVLELGQRVCYGLLLEELAQPGSFVVAIRGTANFLEWVEDGEFIQCPHPLGGRAESGFWAIYESMDFRPLNGGKDVPLASGIADAIGEGTVTVAGHSLGAALATYLTLDLAERPGLRVKGRFFASPRPGDHDFADLFDKTVADYMSWAYVFDAVPHVPLGLGYTPLHNLVEIRPSDSQARIAFGLGPSHHLVCYLAELDYKLLDWRSMPPIDQPCAACIKGPA
jgi:triacylglycerol lipase